MSADSVLSMGVMRRCCDHLLAAAFHALCPTVRFDVSLSTESGFFSDNVLPVVARAAAKVGRKP